MKWSVLILLNISHTKLTGTRVAGWASTYLYVNIYISSHLYGIMCVQWSRIEQNKHFMTQFVYK